MVLRNATMLKIVCLQSLKRKRDRKILFNRSFKNLFVYFSHELIIELVILIEKSNFGLSLTISELTVTFQKGKRELKSVILIVLARNIL